MKSFRLTISLLFVFLGISLSYWRYTIYAHDKSAMYFCTAANDRYFKHLLNLIGSIYRVNFDETKEIAIFDLGLKAHQKKLLESIEKVTIYPVELTHADLLKPVIVNTQGKTVPGWYAWKPVILKQALDIFPYVLWLDAATTVLKPLNHVFEHIKQNGYLLTDCGHNIKWMTTQYVIDNLQLNTEENKWILNDDVGGVAAGIIGLSQKYYASLVLPMYELTKNLRYFVDDGTTPDGFGTGRYEQTILSIYARLLGLDIVKKDFAGLNFHDGAIGNIQHLSVNNLNIPIHITEVPQAVNNNTILFCSRHYMPRFSEFKNHIRFKQG